MDPDRELLRRWQDICYLAEGSESQRRALQVLTELGILADLVSFDAVLVGTVPIGLDLPGSDLDIVCCAPDVLFLAQKVEELCGQHPGYEAHVRTVSGGTAWVANFESGSFPIQLFIQELPVTRQRGYRHLLIEDRLLQLAGAGACDALRRLRAEGPGDNAEPLKTEPAFAHYFDLEGDPYRTLYEMSDWDQGRLFAWYRTWLDVKEYPSSPDGIPAEEHGNASERGSADWWDQRYRTGDIPWDTGIVPPEVVALVDEGLLTSGWALDIGCGSGLSSRYLARHGFRVVGVDLARSALERGNSIASAEGLPAFFCLGDAADLSFLALRGRLALDVGCFHALPVERRAHYVTSLASRLEPGAYYLLYAFEPTPVSADGPRGIGPSDIAQFVPLFNLRWAQHGRDRERPSAWYLFRRSNSSAG